MGSGTKIKIDGLRDAGSALVAAESGADFTGFAFVEGVRRQLQPAEGKAIIAEYRKLAHDRGVTMPKVVGLFRDQEVGWVNDLAVSAGLEMAQLCGEEDEAYFSKLRIPLIKVVRAKPGDSVAKINATVEPMLAKGHLVALDRYDEKVPGGAGIPWDWSAMRTVAQRNGVFIAGGLTPSNVGQLVSDIAPWGVDVSSGVETDGIKDPAKIRAFIAAVRSA